MTMIKTERSLFEIMARIKRKMINQRLLIFGKEKTDFKCATSLVVVQNRNIDNIFPVIYIFHKVWMNYICIIVLVL